MTQTRQHHHGGPWACVACATVLPLQGKFQPKVAYPGAKRHCTGHTSWRRWPPTAVLRGRKWMWLWSAAASSASWPASGYWRRESALPYLSARLTSAASGPRTATTTALCRYWGGIRPCAVFSSRL